MCRNPMFAEQYLDHFMPRQPKIIGSAKNYTIEMKKQLEKVVASHGKKLITINCGQCADCKLQKSREWATRCMLETREHKDNYFLTLTYDNEHLPLVQKADLETGELLNEWNPTLYPPDLQKFWKRLRDHWKRKHGVNIGIRYYACGEYGEKKDRPHYHAIVFGLPINDLKPDHKSKRGNMNFISEEIQKIWGNGIVAVGDVTWESCAYTARYIMKKQTGKGAITYYLEQRAPEFCTMSRRPAIGKAYFDKNWRQIYANDGVLIKTKRGVESVKPARYFDKLFDIDNHEEMQAIKRRRIDLAEIRQLQLEQSTDKDWEEVIKDREEMQDLRIKTLKRHWEMGNI